MIFRWYFLIANGNNWIYDCNSINVTAGLGKNVFSA